VSVVRVSHSSKRVSCGQYDFFLMGSLAVVFASLFYPSSNEAASQLVLRVSAVSVM
jgi:hypothetical protein